MNRLATAATTAAALFALAACGSGSAATNTSSSSSSTGGQGGGNGAGRNGAAGELVQVNGTTLILNSTSGDITVKFDPAATPVAKTSTGSVADIVAGVCITAAGTKDASSAVTASTVSVRNKVGGSCTVAGPGGAGGLPGGLPGGNRTPDPNASPRPTPRNAPNPNAAFARGEVSAVSGTSVTITLTAGGTQTITVPTTVVVSKTITGSAADLTIGSCVAAIGAKDASGTVTARQLSIQPAGPSGCFTGGRGGRGFGGGGFGGGGFPGGGGGGGGAPGD